MTKLVLLGGGHAHLFVLEAFARQRPDADIRLITPEALTPYSGMLPGVLAGHYRARQACIDLRPLAERAGCRLTQDSAIDIDGTRRRITLAGGEVIDYDLLSIDTGSTPRRPGVPGAVEHALPVKPIAGLLARCTKAAPRAISVLGAGAAGVEVAMALHHRWPQARCTLIERGSAPLEGYGARLQRSVCAELARQRIDLVSGAAVTRIDADVIRLDDGRTIAADFTVLATGATAPAWLQHSGLALDARGFIAVGGTLQSLSHPEVFAAGDVATLTVSPRPKSGVYAVRAGPPLAANITRVLGSQPPLDWRPQRHALMLLACGRRHAIAARGGWVLKGDWVWRWKDAVDRGFVRRFDPQADLDTVV
jgi:pyridine nucleotide-disulfide oxidoreductase family protein